MNKKYIVRLSDEERSQLAELTRKGQATAYKIRHALILTSCGVGLGAVAIACTFRPPRQLLAALPRPSVAH